MYNFDKKILIHYHIHYNNLAIYYLNFTNNIYKNFGNLFEFVITCSNYNEELENNLNNFFKEKNFTNYKIIEVKNMGADISPMFQIFENKIVNINEYIALIHIHTKNHKKTFSYKNIKNILWGNELIKYFFNNESKIIHLYNLFKLNIIGIVGNNNLFMPTNNNFKNNKNHLLKLIATFNIDESLISNSKFIGGNMWWCHIDVIKEMCTNIKSTDFTEKFASDGNLEHAVERFVGIMSNQKKFKYAAILFDDINIL